MILTTTLNLAWDVTYRVRRLKPGAANTVELIGAHAGGKGVNVSRILNQLGVPTVAMGFIGGATGRLVVDEMNDAGVNHRLIPIQAETRRCMAVISEEGGDVTEINEQGPEVPRDAWDEFVETFREVIGEEEARVAVLCGSLPPVVPADAYATLCAVAHDANIPVILDSSGAALKEGLTGRPDIVKPNKEELLETVGEDRAPPSDDVGQQFDEAEWIPILEVVRSAGAGAVVATFGSDGLLAVADEGAWFARPLEVRGGNPVGAGDAVAAALAKGLLEETTWPDRLREAAALSAAAAGADTAGRLQESASDGEGR
jgi:1-phosphofructokinase family hexose kinase